MTHRLLHYSMALLMALFTAGGGLAVPLLATQLGSSELELGVIGSVTAATYTLVVISAGSLSDRLGRKRVIIAGTLLAGLSYALMPLSRAPLHLIVPMALCGCGLASFWPVLEAWMSEEGGAEEIRKELGAFNVSWSAGNAVGPLVGGLIYTVSSTLAFMVTAAGVAFMAVLAALHKKPAVSTTTNPVEEDITIIGEAPEPVSRQLLYSAWIANFASWFAISEIRMLFPKLGVDLGMQPWVIGSIIFALGLALTGIFYVMGASGRWHNRTAPLLCAQGLIVILLLASLASDSPIAFGIIFAGLGIGFGVTYSYSLYCSVVGSLNKGAASGRHEMVLGTGALLGPLMGGAAAQLFHAQRAPYILAAGLMLAALFAEIFILVLWRVQKSQDTGA